MKTIPEPRAMAEIREIRKKLSEELSGLSPDERVALIKKGAAGFEEKFGIKLRWRENDAAEHP